MIKKEGKTKREQKRKNTLLNKKQNKKEAKDSDSIKSSQKDTVFELEKVKIIKNRKKSK